MRTIRLALLLVCALAAPAAAQEPAPATPFPALATTDRTTDHSSFHGSLALSFFEDDGPDLAARVDLGGQYLTLQGIGGYATIPVSYLSGNDESETAIGNIELGGLYVAKGGPNTSFVVRGGLMLPTAPDDLEGLLTNVANLVPRFTDFMGVAPEVTALRLSVSPLHRSGIFFARADAGIDIAIDEADGSDTDPFIRLNLAAGVETSGVVFAGELVTIGTTGEVDENEDRFFHTLAVSGGLSQGKVRPFGALIVPLDDFLDVSVAIMAGVEAPLGAK
jgi:hypothetical protein